MKIEYTKENIEFYSGFPSYKIIQPRLSNKSIYKADNLKGRYIWISKNDLVSIVKISAVQVKYISYVGRAIKKGLEFSIHFDLFVSLLKQSCVYCGGCGGGIDRVESSAGYTVDNSVPCCSMCNMMKYTFTRKEFLDRICKIYKHNK